MQDIKVTRYADPKATGWAGYIEPKDRTWIAFVGLDGRPVFFLNRDPMTGAVIGDDPATHEADVAAIRARNVRPLHTGVTLAREDLERDPGIVGRPGEVVVPLGIYGGEGD